MKPTIKYLLFTVIVFTSKAFTQVTTYLSTIKPLKYILIQINITAKKNTYICIILDLNQG